MLQSNPHVSSSKSSSVQGYDAKACIVPARSLLCRLAAFSATSKVDPQGKTFHEYEKFLLQRKAVEYKFHCSKVSVEHSATLLAVGCIGATASTSTTAAA